MRRVGEKGGVGIPVIVSLIGGAIVLYVGYSFVGSLTAPDLTEPAAAPVTTSQEATTNEPAHAQSFVSFDENFFQSEGNFYIRLDGGVDENGNQVYTYIKADIADAKTFHRVPITGDLDKGKPQQGSLGGTMPAFYIDSKNVYFFSGTEITVLQGADPATFQVLSPTYAKDDEHVYVITVTCTSTGTCTGTVTVISGADPDTFQTFHDTVVPDPDGTGEVKIDAKDKDTMYYYGTWVGPLPDPDDHTLHIETDHPVLISP